MSLTAEEIRECTMIALDQPPFWPKDENVFQFTIEVTGSATQPLNYSSPFIILNGIIDWGDGSKERVEDDIEEYKHRYSLRKLCHSVPHQYSIAGQYIIKMKGEFLWLSFYNYDPNNDYPPTLEDDDRRTKIKPYPRTLISVDTPLPYITENEYMHIPYDYSTRFSMFVGMFSYCSNLKKIASNLLQKCQNVHLLSFDVPYYGGFGFMFGNCSSLKSIPENTFKGILTNLSYINMEFNPSYPVHYMLFYSSFCNCSSLMSIPEGLFFGIEKCTYFDNCFYNCSSLRSIPSKLFKDCKYAISFSYCFMYCLELYDIPASLFSYCESAKYFDHCFGSCSSLFEIPNNLFLANSNAVNFSYCFYECISLLEIPNTLFNTNVNATDFSMCFYHCTSLHSIPDHLFDYNVNATNFASCFSSCEGIDNEIPYSLFINCNLVTKFNGCFANCENIPGRIPDFSNCQVITSFNHVFYMCDKLEGPLPSNLFTTMPNLQTVESCFAGCTSLLGSPPSLEQHTYLQTCKELFAYCTSLTGSIPEGMFSGCTSLQNASYCFQYCRNLDSMLDYIFYNCRNLTDISMCFWNCRSISSYIPDNIFKGCLNIQNFGYCFDSCESLQGPIPSTLFSDCVSATSFEYCFQYCRSLNGEVPGSLFDSCLDATNFSGCFSYSGITGIGYSIFARNVSDITISGCFSDCTKIYDSVPDLWNTLSTSRHSNCFKRCYNASNYNSIPTDWGGPTQQQT